MALTEVNTPAAFALTRDLAPPTGNALPHNVLDQLSRLRDEAGRDLRLARFLARAPKACIVLLAAGSFMALAGHGALTAQFTWAVMLLAGIIAITGNHMRSFAAARPNLPLQAAASQLRGLLLYTGLAWGSGAFLVLPAQPVPLLAFGFATLPAATLALVLKDRPGTCAFAVPAAVATVIAAMLNGWPQMLWLSAAILAALPGILIISASQQKP